MIFHIHCRRRKYCHILNRFHSHSFYHNPCHNQTQIRKDCHNQIRFRIRCHPIIVSISQPVSVTFINRPYHFVLQPQFSETGIRKISDPAGISTSSMGLISTFLLLGFSITPENPIDSHRNIHTARDSLIRPFSSVTSPAKIQPRSTTTTARLPVFTGYIQYH